MEKKTVVVLGAGFGGLRAAIDIAKGLERLDLAGKYKLCLVDRNDRHVFLPLLYRVAAGPGEEHIENCTYDIAGLVRGLPIEFVNDSVVGLDLPAGGILLEKGGRLHADHLVIALGSDTNYFGIPGLEENALQLKTLESAIRIRNEVSALFAKGGAVKIVVGGAGPNGVELASELRLSADSAESKDPGLKARIILLEAMETVLPGLDDRVSSAAKERLHDLGVETMIGKKIAGVSAGSISIDGGGAIDFDAFVWTGGSKSPSLITSLPLAKEARGRVTAESGMECVPGSPDLALSSSIYGIGDNVCFYDKRTGKPVPAVAHVAILEARVAAHNLLERIKNEENPGYKPETRTFEAADYPYVIPAGGEWAVAKLGPVILSGWLGWEFSRFVELNYLLSIMPLGRAIRAWFRMRD